MFDRDGDTLVDKSTQPSIATSHRSLPLAQALALAERLRADGRRDESEALCRDVLGAHPASPEALHMLAVLLHQKGELNGAIKYARHAIERAPNIALYHSNLSEMLRQAGHPRRAIEAGERAIALDEDYASAWTNVGAAYYELKQFDKAVERHSRAVALAPQAYMAHSNLGNALHSLRRFAEAAASYRRAVELKPDYANAWSNLGTALHHDGRHEEALLALRRALALDPTNANAHTGLGILLLMRGDYAEGWSEYAWRLKSTEVRLPYRPLRPWRGESLAGKRIYIHGEQGFGDSIQFSRYLPLLAARGAAITFRVQQALTGLMRQSLPGIEVIGDHGPPAAPAECEAALLSLPHLLGTRLETIPAATPYLVADPAETARWRSRIAAHGLKVGLVWAGNHEHINDGRRSTELAELEAILATPNVAFISLQLGKRAKDLARRPYWPIADVSADLVGFAATAAAMSALDLVITIDSAAAHLAGALAKPTWILIPWVADWRWLREREDSPWYPTARLFRQRKGEAWREVAARVARELARVADGDTAPLTPYRAKGDARAREVSEIISIMQRDEGRSGSAARAPPALMLAIASQRRGIGKLAEAEAIARRVAETEPDSAGARHLLGIVSHQSGNLSHAIEHLRQAVGLEPDNVLYRANLGEMLRQAGQLEGAIAEARRAIALDANFAEAHNNLGIAHYQKGAFHEALSCYDRAIELRASFVEAYSNRGNALRALNRLEEAAAAYRRAIDLRPQFAGAWNNLGTTLRDLQRFAEAEDAYRRALALKPDDPATLNNLGLTLRDMGQIDSALATLERSSAIESSNARTWLHIAILLFDQGRFSEAQRAINRALKFDPQSAEILSASGRIALKCAGFDREVNTEVERPEFGGNPHPERLSP